MREGQRRREREGQRDVKPEMDMRSRRRGEAPSDEAVAMPKTRRTKHTCAHTHTHAHTK